MATTVEVLAEAFKEAGTPFIVGHPGGESVELMEAGRQRQMRFLLMKQEVAGAMLAATWGDITGSPGVCLSTRGPGAANMVNGVAHALPRPRAADRHHRRLLAARPTRPACASASTSWRSTRRSSSGARRSTPRPCASRCAAPCARRRPRRRARCISICRRARRRARPATYAAEPPLLPNSIMPGPDRADLKPALDMLGQRRAADPARRPRRALGAGPRPSWCSSPSGSARRC